MSSGTSLVVAKKKSSMPANSAIDSNNDSQPPLDYSYLKITNLSDIYDETPRPTVLQKKAIIPVKEDGKSGSRCLRLNNNALVDIKLLSEICTNLFDNPSALGWLDLSFNELVGIDAILCEFEGLEILYLHGNQINNIGEVEKLQSLKNLRKLTLHGNPVENVKGYRHHVLALMPWLQNFDFSAVTKADRRTAETWGKMNKTPKKKKKEM
ncbi:hypothetical protein SNE40_016223 [Patella caerulea]|uniref:Leucine-rich repeat-containing protein 51 n=1 Tax=Patella caerulea TaxID=87958 RepID=A0AAN8J9J1_PATCE